MWNEGDPRRELRGHEVAMGRSSSEVVVLDDRVIEAANRAQPGVTNINVTKSSRLHIGPKFVSVTQNVDNTEVVKVNNPSDDEQFEEGTGDSIRLLERHACGRVVTAAAERRVQQIVRLLQTGRILGLELVSPQNSKRLRCSIAVFVCWAFVVASGLTFLIFYFALAKHPTRLDLDLPLPRYLWDIAKSTTRAERLSCAAAIIALLVCIILIVYFTVIAKKTADSVVDVAPHEWFITRDMWLAPPFLNQDAVTQFAPLKLVIIAHTVSSECTLFMNCAAELRTLQSYFAANHGYDLPYNFLIGNEGRVYEGRGWNKIGAHTLGYNRCTLGIGFIGDYREGLPSYSKVTDLQLLRAKMLLDEGVTRGYLDKDYHVVGAKDVQDSLSPGTNLYRAIQKWHNYNKRYAGQSCEAIHGIIETSTATQTVTLPPTLKNLTARHAADEWFITREMWLAPPFLNQDPVTEFAPLKLVIVHHTVSSECTEFTSCAAELRSLQSYFASHFGYDIPYNFLIGNEGRVYEGRGWNRIGAHTIAYNNCTLGIGFIGDYREGLPSYSKVTDLQLLRAKMLLDEGVTRGYLDKDYHVVGARDVMITQSPGSNLYEAIKKWDHYAHDTNYAGKSCEAIHGVNQTSAAAQMATLPPIFKSLTGNQTSDMYLAPHQWFITRELWLAPPFLNQDSVTEFAPLKLVIVHHTVSSECTEFTSCAAELRNLQSYFATHFAYDIPYNFLIGNEGRVYEGRGWNRIGAHTIAYNNCTLGIGFIGDYREGLPSYSKVTDLQLLRAKMLLDEGVTRGYLDKDYHVVGARDVMITQSPGSNLYEAIKKWDHYAHDTNYAGKSCEAIHGVNQTSAAAQMATLPPIFKSLTGNQTSDMYLAPHQWFITRELWLAPPFLNQDSVTEFAPLKLVIVHHTVSSECTEFTSCAAELRNLQSYFATHFAYDIPYNFLIGNEGRVYEGRGWNRIGAHTIAYNNCTLGIGFIGDYREGLPSYSKVTDLQLLRAKMLLDEGVTRGYLDKDYHVVGARDVMITQSPGSNLYEAIKKWDHYAHDTNYAGKSCEAIHGVNQTSAAAQMATLPPIFKSLTGNQTSDMYLAPHQWFITRELWLAPPFLNQDSVTEFAPLKLVIVHHTVSSECTEFTSCAAELRNLQSYFATHFAYDIPYNFLIGNEGRVYEGRGWNRIGAHTIAYNNCTLGIGFIGDYREGLPSYSKVTDLQLLRAKMLLDEGVTRGYLDKDYHVVGAKDVMSTQSPGSNLYEAIKKWDHYAHDKNYAGKSCEAIHGVNQTSAATTQLPTFKNLKDNLTFDTQT